MVAIANDALRLPTINESIIGTVKRIKPIMKRLTNMPATKNSIFL